MLDIGPYEYDHATRAMIEIADEVQKCTTRRNDRDRRCYEIKIYITTPRRKQSSGECCQDEAHHSPQEQLLPLPPVNCPPPPLPPVFVCHKCKSSDKRKSNGKCQKSPGSLAETASHSDNNHHRCCNKPPRDAHCQRPHKEVRHREQQTVPCHFHEAECQTDVQRACDATGIAHDRKTCLKPCCIKKESQNKQTFTNCQPAETNKNVAAPTTATTPCCNNPGRWCERKHEFPFPGRTPSGNLVVHPDMVNIFETPLSILFFEASSLINPGSSCSANASEP